MIIFTTLEKFLLTVGFFDSGRIHYKITFILYSQVRQILFLIKFNRAIFCIKGCLIHDLLYIFTEHLGSLGT